MKKSLFGFVAAVTSASPAPKKRGATVPQNERIALLDAHWASLSPHARAAWNAASARMKTAANPHFYAITGPAGYTAFCACNSALLTAGCPLTPIAPQSYAPPPPLPALRVTIAFSDATPVITLVSDMTVPAGPKLVLWATKAVSAGSSSAEPRAFYKIGVLTGGIPVEGVSIGTQYLSVFPAPPMLSEIHFKVIAISGYGFTSPPADASGVTPALTLAAGTPTDEPGLRAA